MLSVMGERVPFWYATWSGFPNHGLPQIFPTWDLCARATQGCPGALYQKFQRYEDALRFMRTCYESTGVRVHNSFLGGLTDATAEVNQVVDWYYAVYKGFSGYGLPQIFPSWPLCAQATQGCSGARFKKFRTYGEAESYIQRLTRQYGGGQEGQPREDGNPYPNPYSPGDDLDDGVSVMSLGSHRSQASHNNP